MVAAPKLKAVTDVPLSVVVPERVVVVFVNVVVAPRVILEVAPESRMSLPVT